MVECEYVIIFEFYSFFFRLKIKIEFVEVRIFVGNFWFFIEMFELDLLNCELFDRRLLLVVDKFRWF